MLKLAIIAIHALRIILSSAVLGLSITLAKGQIVGSAPSATSYATFLGVLGMVSGAFGIFTVFINVFDGIIVLIIEGLVTMLFIAGGIALAVMLKGGQCDDVYFTVPNKILNCGVTVETYNGESWLANLCVHDEWPVGKEALASWAMKVYKILQQRCQEATADYALIFVIVLSSIIALWLGHAWRRKVGK